MPRESKKRKSQRAVEINDRLAKEYPQATCSLEHRDPFELLVSTILAAQCTDQRVNMVTPDLFNQYPTPADFARAEQADVEQRVRSCGFYRNKAKNIIAASRKIAEDHGGEVPRNMDDLLALPGVARKTANVVLGTAYGINAGVVVDTHVTRLTNRLKLTAHKTNQGDRIEKDLMELLPAEEWTLFSHRLVFHGRNTCTARKPDCEHCCLGDLCPSEGKV